MKTLHKKLMGSAGMLSLAAKAGPLALGLVAAAEPGVCNAFAGTDFDPQGNGTKGNIKIATYKTTADSLATVETAGYFSNDFVSTTMVSGDLLTVNASDGINTYVLTVSGTTVTIAPVPADGLVTSSSSGTELPTHGHVVISEATAVAHTLGDPVAGEIVSIINGGGSTAATIIPTTTDVFFGSGANRILTFNAIEDAVVLRGQTTKIWDIISNVGSVVAGTT
jgi:hypothetical protein